jgi:hypothetical protein
MIYTYDDYCQFGFNKFMLSWMHFKFKIKEALIMNNTLTLKHLETLCKIEINR